MAITATLSVVGPGGNTGTVIVGQPCTLLIALTNNNAAGANVSTVQPQIRGSGSGAALLTQDANFGDPLIGPNSPYVYIGPNGGTLTVPVSVVFGPPSTIPGIGPFTVNSSTQNNAVNSTNTYDVGATIDLTDANTPTTHYIVNPSVTTVTVNALALPCTN